MFLVFVTINYPLGINNNENFLRGVLLEGFCFHGGVVHTAHKTGATRHYSWAIRDDGSFCLYTL